MFVRFVFSVSPLTPSPMEGRPESHPNDSPFAPFVEPDQAGVGWDIVILGVTPDNPWQPARFVSLETLPAHTNPWEPRGTNDAHRTKRAVSGTFHTTSGKRWLTCCAHYACARTQSLGSLDPLTTGGLGSHCGVHAATLRGELARRGEVRVTPQMWEGVGKGRSHPLQIR